MNLNVSKKKVIAVVMTLILVLSACLIANALSTFTLSCPSTGVVNAGVMVSGTYSGGTLSNVNITANGSVVGGGGPSTPGNWNGGFNISTPGTYTIQAIANDGTVSSTKSIRMVTPTPNATPTPTPVPATATPTPNGPPSLTLSCPSTARVGQSVMVSGTYANFALQSLNVYAGSTNVGGGGPNGAGTWQGGATFNTTGYFAVKAVSSNGVNSNTVYVNVTY